MGEDQEEQQEHNVALEKLELELDSEKKRSEEYLTRIKYLQADFENLKKRLDRQMDDVRKYSNERLILELLEVVDELEMAVRSGRSSKSMQVLVQGVEMTLKKLRRVLESEGVYPISCVGKPFDPSKHNAVARIEKDGIEECMIIEEVRKGYIMKEKVIRPSIVKITVKPSSKSQMEMSQHE